MAAVSLFKNINMAAVTSCENTLLSIVADEIVLVVREKMVVAGSSQ